MTTGVSREELSDLTLVAATGMGGSGTSAMDRPAGNGRLPGTTGLFEALAGLGIGGSASATESPAGSGLLPGTPAASESSESDPLPSIGMGGNSGSSGVGGFCVDNPAGFGRVLLDGGSNPKSEREPTLFGAVCRRAGLFSRSLARVARTGGCGETRLFGGGGLWNGESEYGS